MTKAKKFTLFFLICIAFLTSACTNGKKCPLALSWQITDNGAGKEYIVQRFIIKNISEDAVDDGWDIYFSMNPKVIVQSPDACVKVERINATHHRMRPVENLTIAPGDSVIVDFDYYGSIPNVSMCPEGTYLVSGSDIMDVPLHLHPLPSSYDQTELAMEVFGKNRRILDAAEDAGNELNVIPAVKDVEFAEGVVRIEDGIAIAAHDDFGTESNLLKEKLRTVYGIPYNEDASFKVELRYLPSGISVPNREYYEMKISEDGAVISSVTSHGIFNGTQTFMSLLKGQSMPYGFRFMSVRDYPGLMYRGQMVDIARNFTPVEELKKIIDVMSSYKLNKFHFHFCDDEGWRLEIPGIEELTEVSSRRGHTLDESSFLYPAYDGNHSPESATTGNGHYTREEFVDLLEYASERHIEVIPEIELPGHARAAIVAMEARYDKYIHTDSLKALEYLLSDPEDVSVYESAQGYNDNVINVALPSSVSFIRKVIDELVLMYEDAGLSLDRLQIGGDEVAKGAWTESPACRAMMLENGMKEPRELSDLYIKEIVSYLESENIAFGGWQEAAMEHDDETDDFLTKNAYGIYCWSTQTKNRSDEIVYSLANKGYPVILCNVNNLYFDLMYDGHPDEPGHHWGGQVNEEKSFSILPYDVYRSIRNDLIAPEIPTGKTALTAEGRKNIVGMQSTLFAETVRDCKMVEYYLFPKLMGLSERAWHPEPEWASLTGEAEQMSFEKDLAFYYDRIATREMPYWETLGVNYRLPYPGVIVSGGLMYANTLVDGAEIRYTLDGSEPSAESFLWESPVRVSSEDVIKVRLFYGTKQSRTVTIDSDAQNLQYVDASTLNVIGKALPTRKSFTRIDTTDYKMPAAGIDRMAEYSTGLAVMFRTDSENVAAKWKTSTDGPLNNMAAIPHKGLDLYIHDDDRWVFAGVGRPKMEEPFDTHSGTLVANMAEGVKECLLYLPLFDSISELEIGVDKDAFIEYLDSPFEYDIVVKGSSITHGASASRAGMSYPARLGRANNWNCINLGFSGASKLEKEYAYFLRDIEADAFIFDVFSNPSAEQINERFDAFVDIVRESHPETPMIFLQTEHRESRYFNRRTEAFEAAKQAAGASVVRERMKRDKHIYFIGSENFLGNANEATIDGTHPTDLGFTYMLESINPQIIGILEKYGIRTHQHP